MFKSSAAKQTGIAIVPPSAAVPTEPTANFESSYSPQEIAKKHNLSVTSVRRHFENEPGVEIWVRPGRTSKRRFRTIRIPESILERVLCRIKNK